MPGPKAGRSSKVIGSIRGAGEREAGPPLEEEATLNSGEPGKYFPFAPVFSVKCISLKGQGESPHFLFSPQECALVIVLPARERLYSQG